MEYFANDYRVVHQFARHYQTGQVGNIDFLYRPLGRGGGFCDLQGSGNSYRFFRTFSEPESFCRFLIPFLQL